MLGKLPLGPLSVVKAEGGQAREIGSHRDGRPRPYIEAMQHLDLTEEEAAALVSLLARTIADDCFPLSPRFRTLKAILAQLRPEPVREPLPPAKVYAPPKATSARRRRGR